MPDVGLYVVSQPAEKVVAIATDFQARSWPRWFLNSLPQLGWENVYAYLLFWATPMAKCNLQVTLLPKQGPKSVCLQPDWRCGSVRNCAQNEYAARELAMASPEACLAILLL